MYTVRVSVSFTDFAVIWQLQLYVNIDLTHKDKNICEKSQAKLCFTAEWLSCDAEWVLCWRNADSEDVVVDWLMLYRPVVYSSQQSAAG